MPEPTGRWRRLAVVVAISVTLALMAWCVWFLNSMFGDLIASLLLVLTAALPFAPLMSRPAGRRLRSGSRR